jgi:hypothetical protein
MADNILTQELVQSLFEYRDGELFSLKKCSLVARYALKAKYKRTLINGKQYLIHRIVFLYHYGYLPKCVDHIDGNPLNNKIENLREATTSQNQHNSKKPITNKSGIKGVSWHKSANKWFVSLKIQRRKFYFGLYKDIELAELVAIEARNKYHGNFARHQ